MTSVPWQARPSRNARLLAWLLLLLPIVVTLLYPIAQDYLQAASLLQRISNPNAAGWIANYEVRPVDVHDTTFNFRGKPIPARIYLPRGLGFAPGIVVVHGMHELGINEPRLVNFARALAASGFLVMTPLVPGIADYRVQGESADLIGTAAQSFAQQLSVPKVGIVAISFPEACRCWRPAVRNMRRRSLGSLPSADTTTWPMCCNSSPLAKLFAPMARSRTCRRMSMVR